MVLTDAAPRPSEPLLLQVSRNELSGSWPALGPDISEEREGPVVVRSGWVEGIGEHREEADSSSAGIGSGCPVVGG